MGERIAAFDAVPHASNHCRHYSFSFGDGPRCAFDLPGAGVRRCGSLTSEPCDFRAEFTDAERKASNEASDAAMSRVFAAISALPAPIPLGTKGFVACPSCAGTLHYARWHRGAGIQCETPNCCSARMNITAGADWPERSNA